MRSSSFWTNTKRVFRSGFLSFWRNGFVTLSSILMMTLTLFVLGLVVFTGIILNETLQSLQDKADISIYFTTDAPVDQIMSLQQQINTLPEVATTTYTSATDELAAFEERHQNDQLTLQALSELGSNPLGAVLTIKAKDISEYGAIAQYLQQQEALGGTNSSSSSIIDKVNYFDTAHQEAITTLQNVTDSAEKLGLVIIVILALVTIAISFNTVRLAIYTSRDEISVMQLVGAPRSYIRAPFLVEAMLYGLVSGIVTLILYYPLTYWLGQATENFFGGINVFSYYISHFGLFFLLIIGAGVLLGAVASYLATRRYLKL
ncbi:MAG: ABC transporter permease [Patescibacteria group bacterium]|nr:ABC transporter permease [Patescibacteria group bacterium]